MKKIYNGLELGKKFEAAEKKICKTNLSVFLNNVQTYESMKAKQGETARKLKDYLGYDKISEPNSEFAPNDFMLPIVSNKKKEILNFFNKNGIEAGPHFAREH